MWGVSDTIRDASQCRRVGDTVYLCTEVEYGSVPRDATEDDVRAARERTPCVSHMYAHISMIETFRYVVGYKYTDGTPVEPRLYIQTRDHLSGRRSWHIPCSPEEYAMFLESLGSHPIPALKCAYCGARHGS